MHRMEGHLIRSSTAAAHNGRVSARQPPLARLTSRDVDPHAAGILQKTRCEPDDRSWTRAKPAPAHSEAAPPLPPPSRAASSSHIQPIEASTSPADRSAGDAMASPPQSLADRPIIERAAGDVPWRVAPPRALPPQHPPQPAPFLLPSCFLLPPAWPSNGRQQRRQRARGRTCSRRCPVQKLWFLHRLPAFLRRLVFDWRQRQRPGV